MPVDKTGTKQSGFTLVELVVVMALLSVLLVTLNGFFLSGITNWHRNQDKAEVEENLRLGINRLARELRQASGFPFDAESPAPPGKLSFVSLDGHIVTYSCSPSGDAEHANQLTRRVGYVGNPVARYIKSLTVEPGDYDRDTRSVTVTLLGEKGKSGELGLSTTVTLRRED